MAHAQAVIATVPAGTYPVHIAVNPATNRIYVANEGSDDVTVIDGATNAVLATVPVGDMPRRLAVNPATNKVYVANWLGNSVSVIDGATNAVTATIPIAAPRDLAINASANRVYVLDANHKLVVIDGATDAILANVSTGTTPSAIVVNPATNRIYVANASSYTVTVVDGASNAVLATVSTGLIPLAIAVNPATNKIYVSNFNSGSVTVIDGATNATTTVAVGPNSRPRDLAVNPSTNKVYVTNLGGFGSVAVIDGLTNTVSATLSGFWSAAPTAGPSAYVAVDPGNNRVYVTGYNTVMVFNGVNDNLLATLPVGGGPFALAVNPSTHLAYVANRYGNNVSVIGEPRRAGDAVGTPVLMRPDLAVTKQLLGAAVSGQQVKYLVAVTNVGTAAMPGPITVTDTLGAGLTYISAAGSGWTCTPAAGPVPGPTTVTCTHPGPLPTGGVLPAITVTAQSDGTTEGVTNCAAVKGAKDAADVPLDQNDVNDRFCVETPLQQPAPKPDLAVAKKPIAPLVAGQQSSYQIAVSNAGAVPAPGPIVVTDTLGAGLTYVSAAGSGWTCTPSAGPVPGPATVTCTHPGPVPANGGLPPLTLTAQVAADAKEVKNCAQVKAVEQPPAGPGEPWVFLPDANPANDQACDVSSVGSGSEKPGRICGAKFLDHDGDRVWDATEPGLPNWTIQVKDAAGNVVGSATTGAKGRFCLEVQPGTYAVSEVVKPGWVQTSPPPVPPGTATVTVAAGQMVNVLFGNRPEKKPCCLTFTLQGGKDDSFSTVDGAAAEPANPVPNAPPAWSGSHFDQAQYNRAFAHRFILPEGSCLRAAKLEVRAKPLGAETENDRIYLYSPFGGPAQWVANFGTGSGNAGGADLLPNPWTAAGYGSGQTFTLDLAALPLPGGGSMSLLAALDQSRVLDLAVQDDSGVDFARLTVTFCECAPGEREAVAAEARGGASEVRLTIGKPVLLSDGLDREIDVPPVIRGGRTFLPVRVLAEALGLDVAWDPAERKVTLTRPIEDPPLTVELWVGKAEATVTGGRGAKLTKADAARGIEKKDIRRVAIDPANPDVVPFIENGRLMLPLRFIAETLDLDVGFEPQTQQLTIKEKSSNVKEQKPGKWVCVESHFDWLQGEVCDRWQFVPDPPYSGQ